MDRYTIIPSELRFKAAPSVDQEISITLNESNRQIIEYDRNSNIGLAQVYNDERQTCQIFRPTFKVSYLYANTYTGTTTYTPFQYNLYYVTPEESSYSGLWKGLPQYYEFDFFRPDVKDQHFKYIPKSAYTYNWTYYISYAHKNIPNKIFYSTLNNSTFNWFASDGIPFVIKNSTQNGNKIVSFECICPHGLTIGEYVKLNFKYNNFDLFEVYSLGNGILGSEKYIFNVFNIGYTGTTFSNTKTGLFKRVVNPDNITETTSEYYVREHKILTNVEDIVVTKSGFEKNAFNEKSKYEFSSITPNKVSRVSTLTSSNAYNITTNRDINLRGLVDNQKRPVSELFLTIVNKGYSGYFNQPSNNIGLKQGWKFNLTNKTNTWWDLNNFSSNSNIPINSYTITENNIPYTFYYNVDLKIDDVIDGDFCEWNDYEQKERVISSYYHKLNYNQNIFTTTNINDKNSPGFYYEPHHRMTIRVFSDYIETGDLKTIDAVPEYSYFSNSDQQFRWRDIYTYGFIDNIGRGVDYPFLNSAQYPFTGVIFRLIPEGINFNDNLLGVDFPIKPLIDGCE